MLTDSQRAELTATGITRLAGWIPRPDAEGIADAVWDDLARRGIARHDRSTWPVGFLAKNQQIRKRDCFAPYSTPALDTLLHAGLGLDGAQYQAWGALISFPDPGPWTVPHKIWHFDVPGRGDPDRPSVGRLFAYATDVGPRAGATLAVEGSHELVRRMVATAPGHDAGSSADIRKRLITTHPWFRALSREGGDRIRRFMVDGDEIDGVRVRVVELTGRAGDLTIMLPWTMHNIAVNCGDGPRLMATLWATATAD